MAHHPLSDPCRFDLDAYFARIGYDGPRAATLDVLRALHLRHAQAIAFENLNPLLRLPVRLDTASLVQKLVYDGRGGYCFEQNLLFAHALDALGFRIGGLLARVVYGLPPDTMRPRGHMLLRVEIDGVTWIADVGFGGLTLTGPIALTTAIEQRTPHESFRLTATSDGYRLETCLHDVWTPLYRFTLDPGYLPDCEMASWYLCHHPESPFVTGLSAARPRPDRRYALRNNVLAIYYLDGRVERRVLTTTLELRDVLEGHFGLRLTAASGIDAALARIVAPARDAAGAAT